eukprot:TRINITY_DN8725_c0_g1_i1.p1 TRINITY_DN8725_c0_g1~~TRINITY_DN8725_c0_g1_i1.p1  ORF type:complete len:927 (+),score=151.01 TRINITY_DN8725_c0_g1_i1:26-2806(+)
MSDDIFNGLTNLSSVALCGSTGSHILYATTAVFSFVVFSIISCCVDWRIKFLREKFERVNFYYKMSGLFLVVEVTMMIMSIISVCILLYLYSEVPNIVPLFIIFNETTQENEILPVEEGKISELDFENLLNANWFRYVEGISSIITLIYYLAMLIIEPNKIGYIWNFFNILDFLTIVPGIKFIACNQPYDWFYYNLRFVRLYRSLLFIKYRSALDRIYCCRNPYYKEIMYYAVGMMSFLFCSAAFMYVVENTTREGGQIGTFYESIYFMVVSLTTVGYGDINPVSLIGRIVMIVIVISALAIIPEQTSKFVKILGKKAITKGSVFSNQNIIVFAQNGTDCTEFIKEYFHEDRKFASGDMVIVSEGALHPKTKSYVDSNNYLKYRVKILIGDLANPIDRKYAQVDQSVAVFVVNQKYSSRKNFDDTRAILTALNLSQEKKFQLNKGTVFVQVNTRAHRDTAIERNIKNVLCVEEMKFGLISQSCICKGLSTLVGNLVTSISSRSLDSFMYNDWMKDYEIGLGNELYSDICLAKFIDYRFKEVVMTMYLEYNCLLIGIIRENTIILNPGKMKILEGDLGIILGQDQKSINNSSPGEVSYNKKMKKIKKREPMVLVKNIHKKERIALDLIDCTEIDVRNPSKKKKYRKHVLIITEHITTALSCLIEPLQYQSGPIVILCPHHPTDTIWKQLVRTKPDLYFVRGDGSKIGNLRKAGIETCKKIIIINSSTTDETNVTSSAHYDAKPIVISKLCSIYSKNHTPAIVELAYQSNVRFLTKTTRRAYYQEKVGGTTGDRREFIEKSENELYHAGPLRNPFYAEGKIYIPGVMDSLICQAYFNDKYIDIVQSLLHPGLITLEKLDPLFIEGIEEGDDYFIAMEEVFTYYYSFGYMIIGIYRYNPQLDSYYVVTAPPHGIGLNIKDKLYILRPES